MDLRGVTSNRAVTAVLSLAILSLVGLTAPTAAAAQDQTPAYIEVDPITSAQKAASGEAVQPFDIREARERARSLFQLFGEGDRAWTSLRMVGDNQIRESNTGPGDDGGLFNAFGAIIQSGTANGTSFQTFGIPMMWGAPRSEWIGYLQDGVTSLQNVRGDPAGYTVMWNGDIFARTKDLNAADGLVGNLLSGETSTNDGSCLDHSAFLGGGSIGSGFQLLPASNCTPTYSPGGVWLGDRPISDANWIEHFNQLGMDFEFNRWEVPDELKDQSGFLGNNVAAYGHFNDYNSSVLAKFGNVVPGGSGEPTREGYPLGLDVVFDAFSFTIPTVANAKFWGGLIINNSEALYGVPHDYDSLYVGLGMWPGRSQDGDVYGIPEKGAFVSAESSNSNSPECQDTDDIPLLGNTCGGFANRPDGFEQGAHGVVVLKSPIGDLRNKLFTEAGSPFFMPGHPLAGDTITFNHLINWNFGNWGDVWNQGSDRQRFGVLSSTEENILDGTACQDFFSESTRYRTFWSNDWPNNQCDKGGWVPGDWTYTSHRPVGAPAGPDTLFIAGCGPTGCPVTWRDSTWAGFSINAFGNLSQFHIGPFRLEAGDTTELLLAFYSGKDSVSFESTTDGIIDLYLGFFAGPEAPPPVTIRDIDIGSGVTPGTGAQVTMVWDDNAEDFVDPFLSKFADDVEAAAPGTDLAIIRDANPGIVQRIRDRAADNLKRILIYRSCDGGSSFDADGDCEGDPAFDESGNSVAPGWQAYSILEPDAGGDAPNTFTDGAITPGVTYLYALLAESRGFEEIVITDPNFRTEEATEAETVGTGDGAATNFAGALGSVPVVETSVTITAGGQTVTDDGAGNLVGDVDAGGANTIDYTTGDFDVTFAAAPGAAVDVDADYRFDVFTCGVGACATDTLVAAPSIVAPLSRATSDPNVVSVYVPASSGAGGSTASVEFEDRDAAGRSNTEFDLILTSGDLRSSTFKTVFGNFFEVTEWRTASTGALDSSQVVAQDLARTVVGDTGTVATNLALSSQTFKRTDGVPVTLNDATLVSDDTTAGVITRTFEIGPGNLDPDARFASGFVLVEQVGNEMLPLLATGQLDGDGATPGSFLANPGFPGFLVTADNTTAGTFDEQFYIDASTGDTLSATLDPTLGLDEATSVNTGLQGLTFGTYSLTFADSAFGPGAPFTLNFVDPDQTDAAFDASLAARQAGTTGATDDETRDLVAAELGVAPGEVELVAANIPFTVTNTTHNRTATLAMVDRGEATKVLGLNQDTLSVTADADRWIPGDEVFVIEEIELLRTRDVGGPAIVVNPAGVAQTETQRVVTFSPLGLVCGGQNNTCNPVRGTGFGGWIGTSGGDDLRLVYFSPFTNQSSFTFVPSAPIQGQDIIDAGLSIEAQMDSIQVVPNPYLFFSDYEGTNAARRLLFTHLPPDGEIRVYTVAGNFVQEIDWTPDDLAGNGDLFWDMQTREGNELGPGLYIFVVEATDPATNREIKKMGKFVVIR